MINVFLRTTSGHSALRLAFYEAALTRWKMDQNALVIIMLNKGIREARLEAERLSHSDPYIFSDDDVVIVGKDWIARGCAAMSAHHEYAICSSNSLLAGEQHPCEGEIYPMHSVGAPMFIRKGILKDDLPEMTLQSECGVLHDYVRKKGFKEGIISSLRHLHLGYGFSSTPGLDFGY